MASNNSGPETVELRQPDGVVVDRVGYDGAAGRVLREGAGPLFGTATRGAPIGGAGAAQLRGLGGTLNPHDLVVRLASCPAQQSAVSVRISLQ